jgi:hypothetical protein
MDALLKRIPFLDRCLLPCHIQRTCPKQKSEKSEIRRLHTHLLMDGRIRKSGREQWVHGAAVHSHSSSHKPATKGKASCRDMEELRTIWHRLHNMGNTCNFGDLE